MRTLVTGASGFIGSHVVRELAAGGNGDIVAVSRRPIDVAGVASVSADLLDAGAVRDLMSSVRPTHLLHLAWVATPGRFWTDPTNLDWCASSLHILREFAAQGGRRAVFAGSCAEYSWEDSLLSETTTPLSPATLYGSAKDALRRILFSAAPHLGVSIGWARIFWLYGRHEPLGRLVSDVASAISRGHPAETSEGRQARDFMHVTDVARAFVAAAHSEFNGCFNVGSGEATPVREIVLTLAEALGRPDLLRLGARPTAPGERPSLCADTSLLKREIGFEPRVSLADGLRDTATWWRERS